MVRASLTTLVLCQGEVVSAQLHCAAARSTPAHVQLVRVPEEEFAIVVSKIRSDLAHVFHPGRWRAGAEGLRSFCQPILTSTATVVLRDTVPPPIVDAGLGA
jgi:hypothetical protein